MQPHTSCRAAAKPLKCMQLHTSCGAAAKPLICLQLNIACRAVAKLHRCLQLHISLQSCCKSHSDAWNCTRPAVLLQSHSDACNCTHPAELLQSHLDACAAHILLCVKKHLFRTSGALGPLPATLSSAWLRAGPLYLEQVSLLVATPSPSRYSFAFFQSGCYFVSAPIPLYFLFLQALRHFSNLEAFEFPLHAYFQPFSRLVHLTHACMRKR